MYRMCRPAGAADPRHSDPARLSPQRWAISWHPARRHRRSFSIPPLLSALPTHAHTTEAFCAFCVPSASWARSGFLQCPSGKGGEQCQPCLSPGHLGKPIAFLWHLLLDLRLDGHGLNQPNVTAASPIPGYRG